MSTAVAWQVSVRAPCGHWMMADVHEGLILVPESCACEAPVRPGRLRVWWEARRMRRWLQRLGGVDELA
jgi:hypothetical protein